MTATVTTPSAIRHALECAASGNTEPGALATLADAALAELDRPTTVVDLVRLAYGDCQTPPLGARSLDFQTEPITDFALFSAALRAIGRYNGFDPETVIAAVEPLWGSLMSAAIAREGSPAVYLHPAYWTHQTIDWRTTTKHADAYAMGEKLTDDARELQTLRLVDALRASDPDELDFDKSRNAVRAWWD